MSHVWHFRLIVALVLGAPIGCGGGGVSVGTNLDPRITEMAADVDTVIGLLDEEQSSEDVLDQFTITEVDSADDFVASGPDGEGAISSLAPAGFTPLAGGETTERTEERYTRGRLSHIRLVIAYTSGPRARTVLDVALAYSSTTQPTGDLNQTLPVGRGGNHAYVYAVVTGTTEFRTEGRRQVEPATLDGFRLWHTDPSTRVLQYDLLTTLPALPRAPYRTYRSRGSFGLTAANSGQVEARIEFADGSLDVRTWAIDRRAGVLHIDFERTASTGVAVEGTLSIDDAGTRACRLDDRGTLAWTRSFPDGATGTVGTGDVTAQNSDDVRPLRETLVATVADGRATLDYETILSDGRVLGAHQVRTTEAPASCSEKSGLRVFSIETTTYGGRHIVTHVTKELGRLTFTSTRDLSDGSQIEVLGTREAQAAAVTVTVRDPSGSIVGTLELTIDPSGRASGTGTRTLADGSSESFAFARDVRGRIDVIGAGAAGWQGRLVRGDL